MLVWCVFNGVLWWTMLSHWSSALGNFTVCQHQDLTLVKIRHAYLQQPNLYLEPKWLRYQIFKLEWCQAPQIKKQLSMQPHTWQKRRPVRNTSWWNVTSFTSWRCAQPCNSTLYCTTLHLSIDVPWYTLKLQPSPHCLCDVDAVTMDFDNSLGVACSLSRHTSRSFLFLKNALRNFGGLLPSLFSIKICGLGFWPYSTTTCPVS